MKITNISPGPRGVNTKQGHVWVEAGQTVDIELEDAEAISAANTGWFSGVEAPKASSERDALEGQARELGIEIDNRWGDKKLQAEIDKKLAG